MWLLWLDGTKFSLHCVAFSENTHSWSLAIRLQTNTFIFTTCLYLLLSHLIEELISCDFVCKMKHLQ